MQLTQILPFNLRAGYNKELNTDPDLSALQLQLHLELLQLRGRGGRAGSRTPHT